MYIPGVDEFKVHRFQPFLTQLTLEGSEQVEISHFFTVMYAEEHRLQTFYAYPGLGHNRVFGV